jgi:hypothetical protein
MGEAADNLIEGDMMRFLDERFPDNDNEFELHGDMANQFNETYYDEDDDLADYQILSNCIIIKEDELF